MSPPCYVLLPSSHVITPSANVFSKSISGHDFEKYAKDRDLNIDTDFTLCKEYAGSLEPVSSAKNVRRGHCGSQRESVTSQ